MNNSKKLGILVFLVPAFVIGLAKPFSSFTPQGHHFIAVILTSLALWIFKTDSIPYIAGDVPFPARCLIFKLPLAATTNRIHEFCRMGIDPCPVFRFCPLENRPG
jgi:hypothetical protein